MGLNIPSTDEQKRAAMFLRQACQDYAAARCCLLNGLLSGFVFAQQAVEKVLKAYIFFADAKAKWRGLHDLKAAAQHVQALYPTIDLAAHAWTIERLEVYYKNRYPDVPKSASDPTTSSTAELHAIDQLMVYLSISFPLPPRIKIATGILPAIYAEHFGSGAWPEAHWVKANNIAVTWLLSRCPSAELFMQSEFSSAADPSVP